MGNNQSTPLSLLVTNFKDVKARGRNLSVELKKGKLVTFCHLEWPSFGVGWPSKGTFCLSIITKVKTKIFLPGQSGHPDQIPYILVWQNLVEDPPPWITPFILEPCKVLVTRPTRQGTPSAPSAPVLPDSQDPLTLEPTLPPPYPHLIPQDPVPQGGASIEGNREAEAAESESNPGGPASRTQGRVQRDQASRLPDSTVALPLREIGSLDDTGLSRLMYWPFSTSDLYNWKSQNARFSDNPKDLTSLLDSVMFTHQPTWDDCQQLLRILFTTEERERIQVEARKLVPGDDGQPTANPDLINAAFPLTRPRWDYNTAEGRGRLLIYRQTLMAGLRAAARKPTNLAKVYSVLQGKTESPAVYLERLMEAFRQFTPMDPEAPENQAAVVMSFVNQATPDIKRKLQKLEGLEGKQIQDLLQMAQRVYNNRDTPEEKQFKATKEMTKVLVAAFPQAGNGQSRKQKKQGSRQVLEKDQCAYCKERGHWIKDCPKKRRPANPTSALVTQDSD
uniref:CCHC-type domain-containing protein n=1 Tax=Papio anubis TaxID=9555 RepID=A0A8I5NCX5_PAPAN